MKSKINLYKNKFKNFFYYLKKYLKINIKICLRSIKKTISKIGDLNKFIFYYYWYYKKNETYLKEIFFHNHDHFNELIQIITSKLKLMKKELEKDFDFDFKDMERLNDIIKIGDRLQMIIKSEGLVEKNQEYQKLAKSFFNKLYRLHDKLYSIKEFQNIKDKELK